MLQDERNIMGCWWNSLISQGWTERADGADVVDSGAAGDEVFFF